MPTISLKPNLNIPRGGRTGRNNGIVGLDIQPGYIAAVQAHLNGGIAVQRAVGAPLPPDALREGEVLDERTLSDALRDLFAQAGLAKRVRVGLANQRTVLRVLELPPISDRKELAAAVRFQAEDQVPMPLAQAALDFHSLGIIDTPGGPRQRVVVVAAQREMVERLLRAVRQAGLRPEGVDLSAFALIRSLYRSASGAQDGTGERVLYLNVGGLTNMAIAEGRICRFTRVVGGGLEAMATEIAERRGIPLVEARAVLAAYDLARGAYAEPPVAIEPQVAVEAPVAAEPPAVELDAGDLEPAIEFHGEFAAEADVEEQDGGEDRAAQEHASEPPEPQALETWALAQDPNASPPAEEPTVQQHEPAVQPAQAAPAQAAPAKAASAQAAPAPAQRSGADADVRMVLENGIREIVGEVRNSLDFHRSQDGGGEVSSVVLSGPVLEMAGFAEALEADLGLAVHRQSVGAADPGAFASVSEHRLAIATGLAAEEAPQ
jgi:type IV pilus assembly protein PilM